MDHIISSSTKPRQYKHIHGPNLYYDERHVCFQLRAASNQRYLATTFRPYSEGSINRVYQIGYSWPHSQHFRHIWPLRPYSRLRLLGKATARLPPKLTVLRLSAAATGSSTVNNANSGTCSRSNSLPHLPLFLLNIATATGTAMVDYQQPPSLRLQ